jgi:hypothetical protein
VRILIRIIHKSSATPADCPFIYAAGIAACPGDWPNAELSAFKGAYVFVFLAFNANRVCDGFGLLSQQERFHHVKEVVSIYWAAVNVRVYRYYGVYGSCSVAVEKLCVFSVDCFLDAFEVFVVSE